MEPVMGARNAAVSRRLQMLSQHFKPCAVEDSGQDATRMTAQACAELAAVRTCHRTKDVVYYTRPNEEGGERVRRCQTTHQVVSREFILNDRCPASTDPQCCSKPTSATSETATSSPVSTRDVDILPPSLVYVDSWLPSKTSATRATSAVHPTSVVHPTSANRATSAIHATSAMRPLAPERNQPLLSQQRSAERPSERCGGKGTCGGTRVGEIERGATSRGVLANLGAEWEPKMDVLESPTAYVVSLDLPGVSVEGIRVELREGSLAIMGSRPPQAWSNYGGHITFGPTDDKIGQAVYHRRELAQGPYHATWTIPDECDLDGVSAEFADGVLRVVLPKKAAKS